MGDLAGKKRYAIDDAMKAALQQRYFAGCVDENGVREEIRRTWAENHYLMDTHTAVASAVLRAYQAQTGDTRQSVIVSTASRISSARPFWGLSRGRKPAMGWMISPAAARSPTDGTREPAQILALPDLPIPPHRRLQKRTKWRRPCWTR